MKIAEAVESTKNVRKELYQQLRAGKSLHESVFAVGSEAYFESINLARKLYREGKLGELDPASIEILEGNLGEKVKVKGVGEVYLDFPQVNEGVKPIPGLIRSVAAILGVAAAAWAGGEFTSAKHTPLGQAIEAAAEQGDPQAVKYYKQLDFISDENPALLAKLRQKYGTFLPESVEEPTRYHVYTKNPVNGKVRRVEFTESTDITETSNNRLTPAYWSSRLHLFA
jgi:hypothetical protein